MTAHVTLDALAGRVNVVLLPAAPYSADDPVESITLGISLGRQRGVHAIDSDRRTDFDILPGVLAYTPAGMRVFSESSVGGEYLVMRWCAPAEEGASATCGHRVESPGHSAALELGFAIRRELISEDRDMLRLDELLVGLYALRPGQTDCRADTSRRIPDIILDKIHEEFWRPLTLSELSGDAGRSELQFLREFSRTLGMTPHAYVMETRVQAARRMLTETDAPLSIVAVECGFSHQSHMGRVFRMSLGVTPQQYRRCFHGADSN
ncbi:helix-turn-helix domain-containing protein [Pandoraea anhela]|uniref:AraC family transcriptional regulator n=1 Tax=Pandoraea anhela TaxID=2508295 RepID=A0A5E4W7R7_9BURK|nr:AraC family transcriptional regulator [Pandoraea anhela]VVE21037.1 AraC family transcriptional regulator [Pandoraea anhela]